MIIIVHGEDILRSRDELDTLKKARVSQEIISLNYKTDFLEKTDLMVILDTPSLLYREKTVIIENLLSLRSSKEKDKIIAYLMEKGENSDIIFWDGGDIPSSLLKKFPRAKIFHFKPESNIFKLVDSIRPGNGPRHVSFFHNILKTEPAEIVLVMLGRQFRNMIMVKENDSAAKTELAPWQKMKLEKQAKYFKLSELLSLHRKILEIDAKIKMGKSPLSLPDLLDIFLINI